MLKNTSLSIGKIKISKGNILSYAQLILVLVCALCILFLIIEFIGYFNMPESISIQTSEAVAYPIGKDGIMDTLISKRNLQIFKGKTLFGAFSGVDSGNEEEDIISLMNKEVSKLVLKGIFSMGDKLQALIWNKVTREDYDVSVGDTVGDFTVVEIGLEEVILEYKGEQAELRL